jgi:hypothetical protein
MPGAKTRRLDFAKTTLEVKRVAAARFDLEAV